jgi:predicted small integral membrane protein
MSQYADFQQRAEQCMRLEKQATTAHDREFFHKMAMAWLGLAWLGLAAPTIVGSAAPSQSDGRQEHLAFTY